MAAKIVPTALPNPVTPLGYDGADFRALLVDVLGQLQVAVGAIALPAGASTLAEQENQTIYLNLITQLRNALATIATNSLLVKPGFDGAAWQALLTDASRRARVSVDTPVNNNDGASYTEQLTQTNRLTDIAKLKYALNSIGGDYLRMAAGWDGAAWQRLLTDGTGTLLIKAGHDGVGWQALRSNTNRNLVNHPRPLKGVIATGAYASVAAGATRTEVNINGAGIFDGSSLYIDGVALACVNCEIRVYIDGEGTPSIAVRSTSYDNRLAGWVYGAAPTAANATTSPVGWGGVYDLPNFIFSGGFKFPSEFQTSLRITVTNGDGANATMVQTVNRYQLWT